MKVQLRIKLILIEKQSKFSLVVGLFPIMVTMRMVSSNANFDSHMQIYRTIRNSFEEIIPISFFVSFISQNKFRK